MSIFQKIKKKVRSDSSDQKELKYGSQERKIVTELLAEKYGVTHEEVLEKLDNAKKYGVTAAYFANKGLFNANEEKLKHHGELIEKKNERYILKTMATAGWTEEETRKRIAEVSEKFKYKPKKFYDCQCYKYTDDEIAEMDEKAKEKEERELKWAMDLSGWTSYELKKHKRFCAMEYGITEDYFPSRCWEMPKEVLEDFATVKDSRALRAKYNDPDCNKILWDKKLFNENFSDLIARKYWVNRDTSFDEFEKFIDGVELLFCKPVDMTHAIGVRKEKVEGDHKALYEKLMAEPRTLYEECVKQHHEMDEFYDGSVNTIRIICLLENDEFVPLMSFARFGCTGCADNIVAGGVGCGVDIHTGIINTPAMDQYNEFHDVHPVSGKKFEGFKVPNWDKIMEVSEAGLRKVPGINYAGWDIAVCEDKAVIIEGNSSPSIGTYQMLYCLKKEGKKHEYAQYLKK